MSGVLISLAMLKYQQNLIATSMHMTKSKFSLTHEDEPMQELIGKADHKTLALWAIDCAERVMPYFEDRYPEDHRPRTALDTLKTWIDSGEFRMAVIRKASLDSHAAARDVGEDNPARSAARAAGQAVATAHVRTHAYGPAIYAQQAVYRATGSMDAVGSERDWQYQRLVELERNK